MRVTFTSEQAEGAWPNGTTVEKVHTAPGDTHKDGARAKVVGSVGFKMKGEQHFIYFVEWDNIPGTPVGIVDFRLRKVG